MTRKDLFEMYYNLGCLRALSLAVEKSDVFDMMTTSLDTLDEFTNKLAEEIGGSDNG